MTQLIDIQNDKPLYLQLVDAIKARISQNFWHLGMMIPSENVLSKEFGISVGTVKKALSVLVQEGVLFRRQGKGTFVAGPDFSNSFFRFFRYGSITNQSETMPGSKVLNITVGRADHKAAEILQLQAKEKVIKIERIRTLAEMPIIVEDIVIPYQLFKGFETLSLEDELLYPIYNQRFATPIIRADEYLQPETADKHTATLLEIEENAPVINIERIAYTYGDRPVECRYSLGRGDHFRYHITVR